MQKIICEEEPTKPSTKLSTLGEALTDVAKRHSSSPELMSKLVCGDLDWIVMKTLEKDRTRRYDTASALAMDVQRHLEDEPILARAPNITYRFQKFLHRHRSQTFVVLAIAILIVALMVMLVVWNHDRRHLAEAEGFRHRGILSQAREQYAKSDRNAALEILKPILGSRHVGPEARLLYAGVLVDNRRYDEAVATLTELLNKQPEIAGAAHSLLARILWESESSNAEKLKEIEEHRQKAEELLPEKAEAYFLRALTTMSIKGKMSFLDKALELEPSHYESLKLRAYINYTSKEYEAVEDDARVMIALRPRQNAGYKLRGLSFRDLDHYKDAIDSLSKAIERTDVNDPECVDLHSHRRQTYMLMGEFEKASDDARSSVAMSGDARIHHFHLFCAYTASGHYDAAETQYKEFLATDKYLFRGYCTDYVFDTLENGKQLNLPENAEQNPAFLFMVEASEIYQVLASKANRLINDGFGAKWSPNGEKLVYNCGVIGSSVIATYDLKTGKTELLAAPGIDPVFSPDGQYIAFNQSRSTLSLQALSASDLEAGDPATTKGSMEVWVMKADGTGSRRLARGRFPFWSADSQRICFTSVQDLNLYSISIHDPAARPTLEISGLGSYANISPDGRYIAFINGPEVFVADRSSGEIHRRWRSAPGASVLFELAMWTPDSKRFSVGGVGEHDLGLWLYDVTTNDACRLLEGPVLW